MTYDFKSSDKKEIIYFEFPEIKSKNPNAVIGPIVIDDCCDLLKFMTRDGDTKLIIDPNRVSMGQVRKGEWEFGIHIKDTTTGLIANYTLKVIFEHVPTPVPVFVPPVVVKPPPPKPVVKRPEEPKKTDLFAYLEDFTSFGEFKMKFNQEIKIGTPKKLRRLSEGTNVTCSIEHPEGCLQPGEVFNFTKALIEYPWLVFNLSVEFGNYEKADNINYTGKLDFTWEILNVEDIPNP